MKQLLFLAGLFALLSFYLIIERAKPVENSITYYKNSLFDEKDTCVIEGQLFRMYDSKSKRIMRAYIKNSQLVVINDGLQFSKYRIIQYVFSSVTDEQMPSFRWYNQRLSPPILQILKNAKVGHQFVFEEIVIVDQQSKILSNQVRPLMIEKIKSP